MLKSVANSRAVTSVQQELKNREDTINPINERVRRLRNESVNKKISISSERAQLLTKFYKTQKLDNISVPIQRALAFQYLMERMTLPIEDYQLIVGIRGTGIKEVPTFPEICCHTLDDLGILNSREKNPYKVSDETKRVYEQEIIPFWKEKTIRSFIFYKMSKEWKQAYDAGVFTEFMEQRNPGHTAGDAKVFRTGLLDIKKQVKQKKQRLKSDSEDGIQQFEELSAMEIVADALITYANRYAVKLELLCEKEKDPKRKQELQKMVEISRWVPAHSPRTFWEALQQYWYVHVGVVTEGNPWDAFSPGRLDQHLYPFYEKEIREKTLTRDNAKELLELFWLKFNNQPAPPKVGVTAAESNTYNDFSKINIGGLDCNGEDGVNDLSYILLEVLDELRTVQPNTAAQISERSPDVFLQKCIEVISPGFGEPPLFNFDVVVKQMLRQGKTQKDALESGCSGCVETGAFGKESYILTGYVNLPKILELTLNQGVDPVSDQLVGVDTSDISHISSFDEFFDLLKKQLSYIIDIKMQGNNIIENIYSKQLPVPFLSLWIDDCVDKGLDYNWGGARYNTQYVQCVGLGTLTDALASIKYHVFDQKTYSYQEIVDVLHKNYKNNEEMRQIFLNKTPKYGNDDEYVDSIASSVYNACIRIVEGYENTPVRKASRRVYFLPTTVHVYFGEVCGATPDGRKAGMPLSEGISPVQGSDRKGITAVLRSISKLDHVSSGGTLLNQRLSPDLMQSDEMRVKLVQLLRAYFKMGAHHVQFNVVSTELLLEAQHRPLDFQNLMVRVAGYSDYFVNLPKGLQDEIIGRTEQF